LQQKVHNQNALRHEGNNINTFRLVE
jgi:hypothetical protein